MLGRDSEFSPHLCSTPVGDLVSGTDHWPQNTLLPMGGNLANGSRLIRSRGLPVCSAQLMSRIETQWDGRPTW
jgi:hypothetical protein